MSRRQTNIEQIFAESEARTSIRRGLTKAECDYSEYKIADSDLNSSIK